MRICIGGFVPAIGALHRVTMNAVKCGTALHPAEFICVILCGQVCQTNTIVTEKEALYRLAFQFIVIRISMCTHNGVSLYT